MLAQHLREARREMQKGKAHFSLDSDCAVQHWVVQLHRSEGLGQTAVEAALCFLLGAVAACSPFISTNAARSAANCAARQPALHCLERRACHIAFGKSPGKALHYNHSHHSKNKKKPDDLRVLGWPQKAWVWVSLVGPVSLRVGQGPGLSWDLRSFLQPP